MHFTIIGTGALGGLIGSRLALAGFDVTFVDRPDVVKSLQKSGITLEEANGNRRHVPLQDVRSEVSIGAHTDCVFLCVKAHQIADALPHLERLGPSGAPVVTTQNGLPWWYFQRHGGKYEGKSLESADPDGRIGRAVDPAAVIGCVAYPAADVPAAGVVRHVEGRALPLGELDGEATERVVAVSTALCEAGFKAPVIEDIRAELWLKAVGAMCFNPVSALTRATMAEICALPDTRALARRMMEEGEAVAAALGVRLRVTIDRRLDGAARVGHHKTSMLQDVENDRRTEIEALVGTVAELGKMTGVQTPTTEAVYALTRLLDRSGIAP